MRHLKKFEELNLETYLKYGEMLKKAGHTERGQKMIDWGKRGIDVFKNINTNSLYSENPLEASKRIYQ